MLKPKSVSFISQSIDLNTIKEKSWLKKKKSNHKTTLIQSDHWLNEFID